ncbi:unnamed protein product [Didymodactylos carnosus]|uniref:Uncharacterized protein n=1 Tax=Didymodactylos carnosus TaxID=1234261 RepID=A0A814U8G0_9BILA|nr:unnamed protein product [Didymodactylos carnosus]CAF3932367.1 unnamed protein product [Didymodactylos carnosus]
MSKSCLMSSIHTGRPRRSSYDDRPRWLRRLEERREYELEMERELNLEVYEKEQEQMEQQQLEEWIIFRPKI